jgi:2-methylcitrate dehydratase PrpD
VLRVTTTDGARQEVRVDANRGGPANPLSSAELAEKFRLNAVRVLDDDAARKVVEAGLALPEAPDVRALMAGVWG